MERVSGVAPLAPQPHEVASDGFGAALARARSKDERRLKEACTEMESFLWSFVLRQMREGGVKGGLFAESPAMDSFNEMLDGERAREMSRGGGLGIGEMLYRELARKLPPEEP